MTRNHQPTNLRGFLSGAIVGILIATTGFALLVRRQNLAPGAEATDVKARVLKLGHSLDPGHPVHLSMVHMAEVLQKKSGGTLVMEIFPSGQLGSETENLEQVQNGALAMSKTSTAPLEGFIPEIALFGVPYAFRDHDHFWKVLESEIGKELLAAGTRVGLRGMCFYDAGARSFYTIDQPVLSPENLDGLKIRVQNSATSMNLVAALGASPTPIPFGELYTALQNRMIDGAENNPPSFHSSRHFEVCKHYSLDEHSRVPDILVMSEKIWQTLNTQQQAWLQESANESSAFQRELWRESSDAAIAAVKKEGVTIHYPEKDAFTAKVGEMRKSFDGTPIGELLRRANEL